MAEKRVPNVCAEMQFTRPDENKIPCSKCAFCAEDRLDGKIKGATLGLCEVYDDKPVGILFYGQKCPYFAKK